VSDASDSNGEQPKPDANETLALDELVSLRSYFDDPKRPHALPLFSDWLRARAHNIVRLEAGMPEDLFKFGRNWLEVKLLFGPAANIFALALKKHGDARDLFSNRIRQHQALATYKDEETPPRRRYEAALSILEDIKPLSEDSSINRDYVLANDAETWGLRGAVFRRLSDLDGDVSKLYRALDCYRCAHASDRARENVRFEGYGAINAAFLLDLLAFRFHSIDGGSILEHAAGEARKESAALRTEVIVRLDDRLLDGEQAKVKWLCETMAVACLGLGLSRWSTDRNGPEGSKALLERARIWAKNAAGAGRAEWQVEATRAQSLRVAYLNEPMTAAATELAEYWDAAAGVINILTGGVASTGVEMARNARLGKVGLALSGGGFRASFYHIGVLARLADTDFLRHIDVLSTVSGGSIVGAHYYLLLRELLESVTDPSRAQYVELVEKLEREFSAAVKMNMRMRGLSNPWATFKMLFKPRYTRSNRMAELYDEHFYSPRVTPAKAPVRMDSLRIVPRGESDAFDPRFDNWRRYARVPALLINATCLNTGHPWQFTATWMGEPPELIYEMDKNERLERLGYANADPSTPLTLGFAVAASACVPGIFQPMQLRRLYAGRHVGLVDGGVVDNQGVRPLLEGQCDFILCSDASGQLGDENRPGVGVLSTPSRAMSILMKHIREFTHAGLQRWALGNIGRNLFFVDLKSELPAGGVDFAISLAQPSYGIDRQIQRYLSEIRTDLDSFSEVEASALMVSGYLMASKELERAANRLTAQRGSGAFGALVVYSERSPWNFLKLEDKMRLPYDANDIVRADLGHQLSAGHSLFFKNVRLAPRGTVMLTTLAALILFGAAVAMVASGHSGEIAAWLLGGSGLVNRGVIAAVALAILVAIALQRIGERYFEMFFVLFGLIGSNVYFAFGLNKWYLRRGSLERLLNLK
jgi:predicted acylesterase/phospholipase RssA